MCVCDAVEMSFSVIGIKNQIGVRIIQYVCGLHKHAVLVWRSQSMMD